MRLQPRTDPRAAAVGGNVVDRWAWLSAAMADPALHHAAKVLAFHLAARYRNHRPVVWVAFKPEILAQLGGGGAARAALAQLIAAGRVRAGDGSAYVELTYPDGESE